MAQLKDSIVSGNLRITGMTLTDTMQATIIRAPSTSGGTSYSAGTSGQILRSNGTSTYWGSISNSDLTTINNTTGGPLGWTSVTQGTALPTLNTIAYWNGAYAGTSSNLEYCKIGKFGSIVTKASTDYVPNTSAGVSAALNLLTTGSSNPELNDYYISQYVNGGTTTTTYHRRPLLSLWNTFKALVTVETTGSGNAITAASIANDGNNRKITFTKGSTFSLSNHTHNYAGSSSAGGAATSANKLNTDAGSEVQPVYFSGGIPVVTHVPDTGEYYGVPQIREGDGLMEVGKYIDFHSAVTSSNDYDTRLQCDDTDVLTLASRGGTTTLKLTGTLPRLRFTQSTSGAAYNSEQCGISAYPGSTAGVNLVMQSGGNEFVGAGESPSNLYYRVITTDTNPYGTSSFIGNEKMFLTSDNEIYFVSGANGLSNTAYTDWTNLKTVLLDSNGCFRPSITEKGSIGSESYYWYTGYITNIYGALNHVKTNPTSETLYGLTFHATVNTEAPKYPRTSDGIRCLLREGTTSAQGYGAIVLGNNIASGTALNKYGLIRMYGNSTSYVQLSAGSASNTLRFSHSASTAGSNISPNTNDIYDLGTSSLRWRNVYARSLDGNLRSAFVYSNESNASSYPWHKFAETTVTAANTDSIITFLMSRTMNESDKIAILSVRIRTGGTKVLASTSSWVHFNYINGDAFDPNDIVAVYTDTANTSCKVELYVKSATRYNGVIATVLKEHSRVGTIDNWTLVEYTGSTNGVASVPAGTGHLTMLSSKQEVLYEKTGGFTKSAYNTVTFSKPVFGVYKLALLIIDQCQIETNSYENAATYILPLDYIKSLGVDPYPPYLTGTGWSTKNNTYVNIPGPESDPWDVAVTYVSDTSLQFSKNGNTNMATNQATVQIIGIM